MSRKRIKSRQGTRSAARIFSGSVASHPNQAMFDSTGPLNVSSNQQIQATSSLADQRRNLASAGPALNRRQMHGGQQNEPATTMQNDVDLVQPDGENILDAALNKDHKFDPSKYISEDFLQILNEHRKNCEREGKLKHATLARKRLKELRIFEEQKRKEETFKRHVSKNKNRLGFDRMSF